MPHVHSMLHFRLVGLLLPGLLVLLLGMTPLAARGATTFTDTGTQFPAVDFGSLGWGDYDADSDLDLLLTGYEPGIGSVTRLYRNTNGTFANSGVSFTGVRFSATDWGDYDNDGDLDLLLAGWTSSLTRITTIYRNTNGVFTDINAGLLGVDYSRVAWGDYDNDGDLDVLLAGSTGGGNGAVRLYRNTQGTFEDTNAGLPALAYGAAWGDYDTDGDLDIVLSGAINDTTRVTRIYRNTNGAFTDANVGLLGVAGGTAAWIDVDTDGDLDIFINGATDINNDPVAKIYRNDGGTFPDSLVALPGVYGSGVAWGDYDADGDADVVITGYTGRDFLGRLYKNTNGAFTDSGIGFPAVQSSAVAWGDYDQDGDLDLALTGNTLSNGDVFRVYRNDGTPANSRPAAPTNLRSVANEASVTLMWDAASDEETAAAGLTYNIRVGTAPGRADIVSAMAAPTGIRTVVRTGNTQHRRSWTITGLQTDQVYYWSVQAIDTGFAGSPFAAEQMFTTRVVRKVGVYLPLISR